MILYKTCKPFSINQAFGVNAAYYAKFHDSLGNPLKGHPGLDLEAIHGTPLYAAHDGFATSTKDIHGGEGVYVRSTEGYYTTYWHLIGDTDPAYPPVMPVDGPGIFVKAGDLIGYADNTGAPYESSGTHCHFSLTLLDSKGNKLSPGNGFDGCIDPLPFLSPTFAQDVGTVTGLYQKLLPLLEQLLSGLQGK